MKCPICKKETTWENNAHRPFCSERCKMIDLGHWADGDYHIEGGPQPDLEQGEKGQNPTTQDKNENSY